MRRIKVRAWDRFKKKMLYGNELDACEVLLNNGKLFFGLDNEKGSYELEVLEFTGLKDKNGKEIYEGDIIKHNYKFGNGNGVIEFNPPSFGLGDKNGFCNDFKWWSYEKEFEVIGNKFENPELLEEIK